VVRQEQCELVDRLRVGKDPERDRGRLADLLVLVAEEARDLLLELRVAGLVRRVADLGESDEAAGDDVVVRLFL
jgi:hypothetical protein